MKPSLHQSVSLRHELRMNPRLYQAMDLLYMPLLDLQQHLKTELLENPFLELVEAEEEPEVAREKTAEEQERERAEAEKQEELDWEEIVLDGFDVGRSRGEFEAREVYEPVPVATRDLTDHLRDQITLLNLTPRQQFLAEEFLGSIGDDGYLQATLEVVVEGVNQLLDELQSMEDGGNHQPPRAAAAAEQSSAPEEEHSSDVAVIPADDAIPEAGTVTDHAAPLDAPVAVASPHPAVAPYTVAEAEELLGILQTLDPPGIAARDLRECLLLQLENDGEQDTLTYRLVRDAFDDLIAHRWSDLAKRFALEPRAVQDAADALAKLDPKPGLQFSSGDNAYVTPDLVVEKVEGEYRVFLNDGGMPRLRISKMYRELAGDKKKFVGENREFVTNKLNSATWLIQAIEQRRQTMLKVMNFIVDRQRDYFEKGVEYLKPLTLREVADVISMHESTVSRVTNQKYVQTPRGVLPLKFFFSSSLGTTDGEDASARSVKAQIRKLVSDEDTSKPLTDSDIVKALAGRGIKIARRTVAKYRDQLNILPARMRKRV
jgi:RNA polymerase sigma-54 factor